MNGIDYSFARPDPKQIKAKGYKFVCRYLASAAGKRISIAEAKSLQAQSLALVLVFEDNANQALRGNAQGISDGKEALSQANTVGLPKDRPIYFAVDFDVQPSQLATVAAYFDGVASVIGRARTGGYGGYNLIKYLFDNKKITYGWQTLAWSGGKIDSRIHIYQNGNSDFNGGADVDEARKTDYGQWPKGEEDMPTAGEINTIIVWLTASAGQKRKATSAEIAKFSKLPWANFVAYVSQIAPGYVTAQQNTVKGLQSALDEANKKLASANQTPVQLDPATQAQISQTASNTNWLVSMFKKIFNIGG